MSTRLNLRNVSITLYPMLLFWAAVSALLIYGLTVLSGKYAEVAGLSASFFGILYAVVGHVAYVKGWTPSSWSKLCFEWCIGVFVAALIALVRSLIGDWQTAVAGVGSGLINILWAFFCFGGLVVREAELIAIWSESRRCPYRRCC